MDTHHEEAETLALQIRNQARSIGRQPDPEDVEELASRILDLDRALSAGAKPPSLDLHADAGMHEVLWRTAVRFSKSPELLRNAHPSTVRNWILTVNALWPDPEARS